jgi:hypothetical protein
MLKMAKPCLLNLTPVVRSHSCINDSREDINGLTREEKKYFFSPMSLSSSVIRIVHAMI